MIISIQGPMKKIWKKPHLALTSVETSSTCRSLCHSIKKDNISPDGIFNQYLSFSLSNDIKEELHRQKTEVSGDSQTVRKAQNSLRKLLQYSTNNAARQVSHENLFSKSNESISKVLQVSRKNSNEGRTFDKVALNKILLTEESDQIKMQENLWRRQRSLNVRNLVRKLARLTKQRKTSPQAASAGEQKIVQGQHGSYTKRLKMRTLSKGFRN